MNTLDTLIEYLCSERRKNVPNLAEHEKFAYFRALCNVRMPKAASKDFIRLQNKYLQEVLRQKGITDIAALIPVKPDVYLWKGDITTLKCDAITNAANSQMLGCFYPNHGCIDNAVHTFAGVELRQECAKIMSEQGSAEPTGRAKITKGYNLPCKYILHTVGPVVCGNVIRQNENDLINCYRACLTLADDKKLQSLAFCCISTGEFRFPNDHAAELAVKTVSDYKKQTNSKIKVIFNVFKDCDYEIYTRLLNANI